MKKRFLFATLLTTLLLVGCGTQDKNDTSSNNSNTSENISVTIPDGLVASYDLSNVNSKWDNALPPEEQDVFMKGDIKEYFINTTNFKEPVFKSIDTINHSEFKGVEKNQYDVTGIKLNGGGLTFNLKPYMKLTTVVFTLDSFGGKDAFFTFDGVDDSISKTDSNLEYAYDITNKTSFTLQAGEKQRFTIKKITLLK